jgi:hypothetical protein
MFSVTNFVESHYFHLILDWSPVRRVLLWPQLHLILGKNSIDERTMHWSGAGSIATCVPEDRNRYNFYNHLIN